jgi:uncharacterized membrane protein
MKKPLWTTLIVWFAIAFVATTGVFAAYHLTRANCPAVRQFYDSAALDANALTAYFTPLAFLGFLITSVYQARYSAAAEQELQREKERNRKVQHDSMWLTVQIARLHTFSEIDDLANLKATIAEIEEHWSKLSQWMNRDA